MAKTYNKVERIVKWVVMALLLTLLPISAYADYGINSENTWQANYLEHIGTGDRNANFSGGGEGTRNNPYLIKDVWDLCRLADRVNGGYDGNNGYNFIDKYFRLDADIDLKDANWYPIGVKNAACFAGNFDGNGHTIKNMKIHILDYNEANPGFSYGLFGCMKGAIRNLNMTGGSIIINPTSANKATEMRAGLLCGYLGEDTGVKAFGAIYGCNIQGEIGGWFLNENGNMTQSYVGGIVGFGTCLTSIYKCQVDVRITLTDVHYIGGVMGLTAFATVPSEWTNDSETPCVGYIFDCIAKVNIAAELDKYDNQYCGGICGFSFGNILACAATGVINSDIKESSDATIDGVEMTIGGLVGNNCYNIMNSISTVRLKGGKTVGGLVGSNTNNIQNVLVGNVANCIYSAHIDSPDAVHTHGLVGGQESSAKAPVNCLFLGTMRPGTNKAPLSDGSTTCCYADRNMYDDDSDDTGYKTTSELTTNSLPAFTDKMNYNIGWQSLKTKSALSAEIKLDDCWETHSGFYPQLKMGSDNVANAYTDQGTLDERLIDYVIANAASKFGDDVTTVRTPTLFKDYAWLASVPLNITSDGFISDFVDTPISLAIKQQTIDNEGHLKNARYSIVDEDEKMTISGDTDAQTATPKDNVEGDVMVTITSDDNVSRQVCLHINTLHQWDGKIAKAFDAGNGTADNPYFIHNARQLMKAFTDNEANQYFKLSKDIWFNDNLLTNSGEPKEGCSEWDHKGKRDSLNWYGHLDGNSHLVRGLFSKNAFGLLEKIHNGASIQNTGFVDCLVWSPDKDPLDTGTGFIRPFGFFTPAIGATAAVRNCLFSGVVKEFRTNTFSNDFGAFIHTIDNSEQQIGENPIIEDCVLSIVAKSDIANLVPVHALLAHKSGQYSNNISARRVLVLNNSMASSILTPPGIELEHCHYAKGYLPLYQYGQEAAANSRLATDMTNGTFFSGTGFDKWTAKEDRFPMLTSFAETAYGKLISLPIYTNQNNRLDNMNYLLDFKPSNATWQVTNGDAIAIDTDIRVLEPKAANSSTFLVRSIDGAKMITPIKTASEITAGITFEDEKAEAFCVTYYDDNKDGKVSLSELKGVTLEEFQKDMNEDDDDDTDNDGQDIKLFPEFRYFAGITDLGTSFHNKENLQQLRLSGKITELSDNDFIGNASMTSFTIPTSVITVSGQAFHNAGLENYEVEVDHSQFAAVDGLLLNKDKDQLLSYPSGRKGTSVDVPNNVTSIAAHAIYKMTKVDTVFIHTADYTTVVNLANDGIVHHTDNDKMIYYVEDATNDDAKKPDEARSFMPKRRTSSETGLGNGHLIGLYKANSQWQDKAARIKPFYTLKVSENSKDDQGRYWATMYIGFDTQLPEGLTAYTADTTNNKMVLHKIGREVPMLTPVVILAEKAGEYKLLGSEEAKYAELPMSENKLNGVGRDSMTVNQSSANEGGCLTLGKNKSGKVGFFIYKGKSKVPAFRAYLTVNTISEAREMLMSFDDEDTNGIGDAARLNNKEQSTKGDLYNLNGQRISQPGKGIYISNGRKFIKK